MQPNERKTFADRLLAALYEAVDTIDKTKKGKKLKDKGAPVKEPPVKKPSTPTEKPKPKPGRDPWKVPEPKHKPGPMNFTRPVVLEAYEDEVDPSNLAFWDGIKDNTHRYSKHPILSKHGGALSRGSHSFTNERSKKSGNADLSSLPSLFVKIASIESSHKDELQRLAIEAASAAWDIDPDKLKAMLTMEVDVNSVSGDDEIEEVEGLDDQIDKRITLNALSHGSAVHNMMTMHHIVRDGLNAISPKLVKMYDQLSSGSHAQYWMFNIAEMAQQLAGAAAGSAQVQWENGEPIVVAKAFCFPVLCQELCKGCMMLLIQHQFTDMDENQSRYIMQKADAIVDEPYLIQVGPEMWRKFLKVVNSNKKMPKMSSIIANLSVLDPGDVHKVVDLAISDPTAASEMLYDLVADADDFEVEDYASDDDESEYETK